MRSIYLSALVLAASHLSNAAPAGNASMFQPILTVPPFPFQNRTTPEIASAFMKPNSTALSNMTFESQDLEANLSLNPHIMMFAQTKDVFMCKKWEWWFHEGWWLQIPTYWWQKQFKNDTALACDTLMESLKDYEGSRDFFGRLHAYRFQHCGLGSPNEAPGTLVVGMTTAKFTTIWVVSRGLKIFRDRQWPNHMTVNQWGEPITCTVMKDSQGRPCKEVCDEPRRGGG